MTSSFFHLRSASPEDASSIASVHVASWRAAYKGIISEAALAALDTAERERQWQARLAACDARVGTTVALDGDKVLGFASLGATRTEPLTAAELYAIYVDPEAWGLGIGVALFRDAVLRARRLELSLLSLWVVEKNHRARTFYERQGMRPDGARVAKVLLDATVAEVRYRLELAP